jgi:hypothetical protein
MSNILDKHEFVVFADLHRSHPPSDNDQYTADVIDDGAVDMPVGVIWGVDTSWNYLPGTTQPKGFIATQVVPEDSTYKDVPITSCLSRGEYLEQVYPITDYSSSLFWIKQTITPDGLAGKSIAIHFNGQYGRVDEDGNPVVVIDHRSAGREIFGAYDDARFSYEDWTQYANIDFAGGSVNPPYATNDNVEFISIAGSELSTELSATSGYSAIYGLLPILSNGADCGLASRNEVDRKPPWLRYRHTDSHIADIIEFGFVPSGRYSWAPDDYTCGTMLAVMGGTPDNLTTTAAGVATTSSSTHAVIQAYKTNWYSSAAGQLFTKISGNEENSFLVTKPLPGNQKWTTYKDRVFGIAGFMWQRIDNEDGATDSLYISTQLGRLATYNTLSYLYGELGQQYDLQTPEVAGFAVGNIAHDDDFGHLLYHMYPTAGSLNSANLAWIRSRRTFVKQLSAGTITPIDLFGLVKTHPIPKVYTIEPTGTEVGSASNPAISGNVFIRLTTPGTYTGDVSSALSYQIEVKNQHGAVTITKNIYPSINTVDAFTWGDGSFVYTGDGWSNGLNYVRIGAYQTGFDELHPDWVARADWTPIYVTGADDRLEPLVYAIKPDTSASTRCGGSLSGSTQFVPGVAGAYSDHYVHRFFETAINQYVTDNEILVGIENPHPAKRLKLDNTKDQIAFPENVEIVTSYIETVSSWKSSDKTLLSSEPTRQVSSDSIKEVVTNCDHMLWWPVRVNLVIPDELASYGSRGTDSINYDGTQDPAILSLFNIRLTPNALNKIRIRFYTTEPGDYMFPDGGLSDFSEQIIYIPYYPELQEIVSNGERTLQLPRSYADCIMPTGNQLVFDINELVNPTINPVAYSGIKYDYRVVETTIDGSLVPLIYSTWAGPNTIVPIIKYIKPNVKLIMDTKIWVQSVNFSDGSTWLNFRNVYTKSNEFVYAKLPGSGHNYPYNNLCQIISSTDTDYTITTMTQGDATFYRFFVWSLPNSSNPAEYLNLARTGPFDTANGIAVSNIAVAPESSLMSTASLHVSQAISLLDNTLYAWAAKPSNESNADSQLRPYNLDPWSTMAQGPIVGLVWKSDQATTTHPIQIREPSGITNLSPRLRLLVAASGDYVQKLLIFNTDNNAWEIIPAGSPTTPISATGGQEFVRNILQDGSLLSQGATYALVVQQSASPLTIPPAIAIFKTKATTQEDFTDRIPVGSITVNPEESNLIRYALEVATVDVMYGTQEPGSVLVTKPVGISKALSALCIEAGRVGASGPDSITCEVQFNDENTWHQICPLGWNDTSRPTTLFLGQYDSQLKSKLESMYGTGAVAQTTESVYSIRLRFTFNEAKARLSKFVKIKGIS